MMATSCLGWYCVPHRLLNRGRDVQIRTQKQQHSRSGWRHKHGAMRSEILDKVIDQPITAAALLLLLFGVFFAAFYKRTAPVSHTLIWSHCVYALGGDLILLGLWRFALH